MTKSRPVVLDVGVHDTLPEARIQLLTIAECVEHLRKTTARIVELRDDLAELRRMRDDDAVSSGEWRARTQARLTVLRAEERQARLLRARIGVLQADVAVPRVAARTFVAPTSRADAERRADAAKRAHIALQAELAETVKTDARDVRLTADEYHAWRRQAVARLTALQRELTELRAWVKANRGPSDHAKSQTATDGRLLTTRRLMRRAVWLVDTLSRGGAANPGQAEEFVADALRWLRNATADDDTAADS